MQGDGSPETPGGPSGDEIKTGEKVKQPILPLGTEGVVDATVGPDELKEAETVIEAPPPIEPPRPTETGATPEDEGEPTSLDTKEAARGNGQESVEQHTAALNKLTNQLVDLTASLEQSMHTTQELIARAVEAAGVGAPPEGSIARSAERLTTKTGMETLADLEGSPQMALMRTQLEKDRPPEGDERGQREWLWRTLISIADTGAPLGSSENYVDAMKLSAFRHVLTPTIQKELDALTLLYNHYVNFSNAGDLGSAEQLISRVRWNHIETLFSRPELATAFRKWEKYSTRKKKDENILQAKGVSLNGLKDSLLDEISDELKDKNGYHNPKLAAAFGLRFGEFLWRVSERSSFQDKDLKGSGEFFLRRLFHSSSYYQNVIKEGNLQGGKMEVARASDHHLQDWLSDKGPDFWDADDQDGAVRKWYRKAIDKGKVDKEGNILDMSDCPLEEVVWVSGQTNLNGPAMVNHVFNKLAYVEATRKAMLAPGGFLQNPTVETLTKLRMTPDVLSNIPAHTKEGLEEERKKQDEAKEKGKVFFPKIHRQELFEQMFKGMISHYLNTGQVEKEMLGTWVQMAVSGPDALFGESEKKRLMGSLFGLPYWLEIPARRLRYLATFWESFKKALGLAASGK